MLYRTSHRDLCARFCDFTVPFHLRPPYDNTKDFSLKIKNFLDPKKASKDIAARSKLLACCFPGISVRNARNAVAASQLRTG
jgi:hypothetical protein